MLAFAAKSLALSAAILVASSALANSDLSAIDAQAAQIQSNPQAYADLSELQAAPNDEILKLAEEIVGEAPGTIRAAQEAVYSFAGIDAANLPQKAEMPHEEWVDILISRSLGEAQIKRLFSQLDDSPIPVRIVFVGIAEGQKLNDAFADFGRWAKDLEHPPEGTIDPEVFSSRGLASVPRMIYMRKGQSVAEVDGLTNPAWLVDQVQNGAEGFLGQRGPMEEISERNLIDVIKERLANIDLEERKKQTVATYWQRARFYSVTPANEDRTRTIDPSMVVTREIVDGRGNVIMPIGKVVNPLQMRPFGMRLVIFNPNLEHEVQWAKGLEPVPGLKDMFIITEVNRQKGWDHFNDVEDALDHPVYLLTQDVHSRFEIEHTPSIVTADEEAFIVREFSLAKARGEP